MANAIESVATVVPAADRRLANVLEAAALADLCRVAAGALDALAAHSAETGASSLRRRVHGTARALIAELAARVVLALAFAAVGCGGSAQPEPLPIALHCYMAPDNASYHCDGRPDPEALAFDRECTLLDSEGPEATPYHWVCE